MEMLEGGGLMAVEVASLACPRVSEAAQEEVARREVGRLVAVAAETEMLEAEAPERVAGAGAARGNQGSGEGLEGEGAWQDHTMAHAAEQTGAVSAAVAKAATVMRVETMAMVAASKAMIAHTIQSLVCCSSWHSSQTRSFRATENQHRGRRLRMPSSQLSSLSKSWRIHRMQEVARHRTRPPDHSRAARIGRQASRQLVWAK